MKHRSWVEWGETGWFARCSCGWSERHHFRLAAQREAKVHRRYPNGNPRLKKDSA